MKELIKALRDVCDIALDAIDDLEQERKERENSAEYARMVHDQCTELRKELASLKEKK